MADCQAEQNLWPNQTCMWGLRIFVDFLETQHQWFFILDRSINQYITKFVSPSKNSVNTSTTSWTWKEPEILFLGIHGVLKPIKSTSVRHGNISRTCKVKEVMLRPRTEHNKIMECTSTYQQMSLSLTNWLLTWAKYFCSGMVLVELQLIHIHPGTNVILGLFQNAIFLKKK